MSPSAAVLWRESLMSSQEDPENGDQRSLSLLRTRPRKAGTGLKMHKCKVRGCCACGRGVFLQPEDATGSYLSVLDKKPDAPNWSVHF